MILVISHPHDDHASAVLDELRRQGASAFLFDLSNFPRHACLSLAYSAQVPAAFILRPESGRPVDLTSCRAVWWRRPQRFEIDPAIADPDKRAFAYNECHEAISGLWEALDAFWINPPRLDDAAAKKSLQLRAASEVGLVIPQTLITNDPEDARAFIASIGAARTIYKAFSATERDWRETRLLHPNELPLLDHVRLAPVIFQEYVPAEVDLRVTIVGSHQFPAAIRAREGGYPFDYRIDMGTARIEPTILPVDVQRALGRLMERLGLVYGAVDMRRTPDGQHVFLEINPAGQWLFVEEQTEQPITRTLAELLMEAARPPR
jgi:hypothetical protein